MDPVREHLLGPRRAWVERVADCADAVADAWDAPSVRERERVVPPFRAALDRSGALAAAPDVLAECVEAGGNRLQADPVAGPPYVVVTSEGLVLRGTLDRTRLVVRIAVFAVDRDPVRYRRLDTDGNGNENGNGDEDGNENGDGSLGALVAVDRVPGGR